MSKGQWFVSMNNECPQKRVCNWYGLGMILLLGWFLAMVPAQAYETPLAAEYQPMVKRIVNAAKKKDYRTIASLMKYPFKREYPISAIKNQQEMLARFDEVFDDAMLATIAQSRVELDWQAMGWRGIILGTGEAWLDYDGKVIAINHQTALTTRIKTDLIATQKARLHPSLRECESPELMWQTEKFLIRIDNIGNNRYRYASWGKGKIASEQPDLVLNNGTVRLEGSGGNHTYQFSNGPYRYDCEVTVIGTHDAPLGALVVYKNDIEILRQPAIKTL